MKATKTVSIFNVLLINDILRTIKEFTCINNLLNCSKIMSNEKKRLYVWNLNEIYSLKYCSEIEFNNKLNNLMYSPNDQLSIILSELLEERNYIFVILLLK